MAKKKSKIAKALAAGLAAYGVAKMMGKKLPVSGKDSEVGAVLSKRVLVLKVHMTKLVYQC
jgi:hypothetical protein